MNLIKYLSDKKFLILFYCVLMVFISLVICLDTCKVNIFNMIYLNIVSSVFFLIYLTIEYLLHNRYYNSLCEIIKEYQSDLIYHLPPPHTYEQYQYHQLLRKIAKEHHAKIQESITQKKEHLEFITSWVHGIKTPIAVSRLILEDNLDKQEIFDSLEEEITKIENYVEQALYYSRLDAFAKDYFITSVQLDQIIKEIIKKRATTFIKKRIKIDLKNIDLHVTTDAKWLTFIIQQIIDNSLKYTDTGGKIQVNTKKDETETRLIITDNGRGILHEDLGRVFHKGFTGYTGRKEARSTGLGLYLAKKLAKKLGHDLSIDSQYQVYTSVTIHFPVLIDFFQVTKM